MLQHEIDSAGPWRELSRLAVRNMTSVGSGLAAPCSR